MNKSGKIVFLAILVGFALSMQNCEKKKTEPTPKQITEDILSSKTWVVSSVTVPVNSATESSDWVAFTVAFGGSMITTGHAAGG